MIHMNVKNEVFNGDATRNPRKIINRMIGNAHENRKMQQAETSKHRIKNVSPQTRPLQYPQREN